MESRSYVLRNRKNVDARRKVEQFLSILMIRMDDSRGQNSCSEAENGVPEAKTAVRTPKNVFGGRKRVRRPKNEFRGPKQRSEAEIPSFLGSSLRPLLKRGPYRTSELYARLGSGSGPNICLSPVASRGTLLTAVSRPKTGSQTPKQLFGGRNSCSDAKTRVSLDKTQYFIVFSKNHVYTCRNRNFSLFFEKTPKIKRFS